MTLQRKVALFCIPLGLVAVVLSASIASYALHWALLDELVETSQARIHELAPLARDGVASRSEALILPVLRAAVETLDADAVWALDLGGAVVAHTDVTRKGSRLSDGWVAGALLEGRPAWRVVESERPHLELLWPVAAGDQDAFLLSGSKPAAGPRVGWLGASLPLTRLRAAERRATAQVAVAVALCVGASVALLTWMVGALLLPVRRLAEAVTRIRRGEYGTQVPEGSSDEVGDLAHSFNQMSAELERTVVSKTKLEEATDFLDSVIEALPVTVFVKDAVTRRYLRFNAAGERLTGQKRAEYLGRTDHEIFDAEQADAFVADDSAALSGGVLVDRPEEEARFPSGAKTLHTLKTIIRGRDGRPRFILGITADVTEAKRSAEVLRRAEKLSAVGALAAGIAHEVNNPLSVILGFAKAGRKRLAPGDELDLPLSSIEREAERCLRLVRDLLTFSRHRPVGSEPFDLNDAVASTRSMLEAQARAKGIELVTDLAASARLVGDRGQLEQVVLNLFSNAVHASPPGGRVVLRTAAAPGEVRLEVQDGGPGIPPELRERVFEPFFTTKEAGQGTGLGLSLVHEIVTRHKGRVEIADAQPAGALLRVVLPEAAA